LDFPFCELQQINTKEMEAKMQYQAIQEIFNSATIHLIQNEAGKISRFENYSKERSIMLLKLWRNDYPYLNNNGNCLQGCLPIPENSEAQRYIRSLTGYTPVK